MNDAAWPLDNTDSLISSGLLGPRDTGIQDSLLYCGLLPSAPCAVPDPARSAAAPGSDNPPLVTTASSLGPGALTSPRTLPAISSLTAPASIGKAAAAPSTGTLYQGEDEIERTYTGSDMRVLIEVPDPNPDPAQRKSTRNRQLIEVTTLSVSIHRAKVPARACGFIGPRGIARGTRTIGGTLVVTQFTVDLMYRFLYSELMTDLSKDSFYLKPDQLPPFDMTLVFNDEYGNSSSRRLLGVDVLTDGVVYSQNDMFTEQTLSYMATDFTPLMPVHRSSLMNPSSGTAADSQKTPMAVLDKPSNDVLGEFNVVEMVSSPLARTLEL